MNPRVVSVVPEPDCTLSLTFNNGEERRLDVRPLLAHIVFAPLRDAGFFALVQAHHGTVAWPGGIDLDPDTVYLDSVATLQRDAAAGCDPWDERAR